MPVLTDEPILLWDNKIPDGGYTLLAGTENSGILFGEAQIWDCLRPYIVTTRASDGLIVIKLLYSVLPNINYVVLGAHRHEPSGYRSSASAIALNYWDGTGQTNALSYTTGTITAQEFEPQIFPVSDHIPVKNGSYYEYYLYINTGVIGAHDFALPEIYLGPGLIMPPVEFPFDPIHEEWEGPRFKSETGRIFESALSKVYTAQPKWNLLNESKAAEVDTFRESVIEARAPFWWFWRPLSKPAEGFMMRHIGKSATLPYTHATFRSFSLNLVEAV